MDGINDQVSFMVKTGAGASGTDFCVLFFKATGEEG